MNKDNDTRCFDHLYIQRDAQNIDWLYLDQAESNTNVLSSNMLADLEAALTDIEQNPPTGLIFLSNKSSGFIAGADITEFVSIDSEEQAKTLIMRGQTLLNRIEALPMPTLALIHGFCLGGGFELSLACQYRIACEDENTRLGLPEVLLGIHPGFGGTVRLIALIGVTKAMPVMLTGRNQNAHRALKLGIVNEVVPRRHINAAAIKLIQKKPTKSKKSLFAGLNKLSFYRSILANKMRKQVAITANEAHYPAPYALIKLWQDKGDDAQAMMLGEADSIAKLFMHPTAKNLVRVFLLQEKLKKLGTEESDFNPKHIHVIGAGVMGGDIAAWCALQGMQVTLQDREAKYIAPAMARAEQLFAKKLHNPFDKQAALDRLIPDYKGLGVEKADVVIEAIIEDLEAKTSLFLSIEPRLKPEAILATNTSSIPLEELAVKLQRPDRLIGVHFFNPVAKMQLIEIIKAPTTDQQQVNKGMRFARLINRLPLPAQSSPGFLVNRVLLPYLLEAVELLKDGVPPQIIDKVATDFGMPMGPIQLADTVGLDICKSVAQILSNSLQLNIPESLISKVEAGKLGKKSGEGFYRYNKGKAILGDENADSPLARDKVQDRLILRLLNECVAVLRENIVANEDLLDAGLIFGTGFAPFRGGPMHYLKNTDATITHQTLLSLEQEYGERFTPDAGWGVYIDEKANEIEAP